MTEDVRHRMFEPFFSTKSHNGANGMGLWLVQGVVADHGGHIAVRSAPDRGTEFSIRLPLRCLTTTLRPPQDQGAIVPFRRNAVDRTVSPQDADRIRETRAERRPRGRGWKTRR